MSLAKTPLPPSRTKIRATYILITEKRKSHFHPNIQENTLKKPLPFARYTIRNNAVLMEWPPTKHYLGLQ